jgi:hypothetical protein
MGCLTYQLVLMSYSPQHPLDVGEFSQFCRGLISEGTKSE